MVVVWLFVFKKLIVVVVVGGSKKKRKKKKEGKKKVSHGRRENKDIRFAASNTEHVYDCDASPYNKLVPWNISQYLCL